MEKYSITSIDDIDTQSITFDNIGNKCPIKKPIKYKNCLCFIKLLNTSFPYGVTKSSNNFWSICCQLNDNQIKQFNKIDELLINYGIKYYNELFELWQIPMFDEISGEKISLPSIKSTIKNNYVTIIKNNKSTVNISLGFIDHTSCYDFDLFIEEDGPEPVKIKPNNINNAKKYININTNGSVLFEPVMWISKNEYGLALNCYQIKIQKSITTYKSVCYLD